LYPGLFESRLFALGMFCLDQAENRIPAGIVGCGEARSSDLFLPPSTAPIDAQVESGAIPCLSLPSLQPWPQVVRRHQLCERLRLWHTVSRHDPVHSRFQLSLSESTRTRPGTIVLALSPRHDARFVNVHTNAS
jgi:hypothetical protein